ncbi:organic hydroperoxide resistance protein [Vibrio sp.]|nr:organic hydroperoxide resistance protein [Vibrio sp.]
MNSIYSTQATSLGGREGHSKSDDGRLDVKLSTPKALGGDDGAGTNPEQLFAAGYSACFIGALKFTAMQDKITLPSEPSITAKVGIGENDKGVGFTIAVEMKITLAGLEKAQAQKLVDKAHQVCPYSNATRGNIDVTLIVE